MRRLVCDSGRLNFEGAVSISPIGRLMPEALAESVFLRSFSWFEVLDIKRALIS